MFVVAMIALTVAMFAMVSNRIKDSMLTLPMVITMAGLVLAGMMHGNPALDIKHGSIHLFAEITLVLILFSDAARIDVRKLAGDHQLPLRLLLIGMPLTILLGTLAAILLPFGISWTEAALLAAILAPTDAALGQAVIYNFAVPVRIRQALNVESGLNDGIAVPLVILFAALAGLGEAANSIADHIWFAAKQLVLGPLAGLAVGWVAAKLLDRSASSGWMNEALEVPAVLATAALAYAAASPLGGNGFISAFVAGLTFGAIIGTRCRFILEFAESEGPALAMLTFVVFGAVMLPEVAGRWDWTILFYAVLSLTIIRMAPVALALAGTGLSPASHVFLGWFGLRSLASILFGLLIVEKMHTPATSAILTIVIVTLALAFSCTGPVPRRLPSAMEG